MAGLESFYDPTTWDQERLGRLGRHPRPMRRAGFPKCLPCR